MHLCVYLSTYVSAHSVLEAAAPQLQARIRSWCSCVGRATDASPDTQWCPPSICWRGHCTGLLSCVQSLLVPCRVAPRETWCLKLPQAIGWNLRPKKQHVFSFVVCVVAASFVRLTSPHFSKARAKARAFWSFGFPLCNQKLTKG